mmetsp:Transcript_15298/g.57842  ORF Transcript_15298/g.57842 Transcript_15298/m.57842 type:complete len:201 (-) Transcript_15298:1492-2094(-)
MRRLRRDVVAMESRLVLRPGSAWNASHTSGSMFSVSSTAVKLNAETSRGSTNTTTTRYARTSARDVPKSESVAASMRQAACRHRPTANAPSHIASPTRMTPHPTWGGRTTAAVTMPCASVTTRGAPSRALARVPAQNMLRRNCRLRLVAPWARKSDAVSDIRDLSSALKVPSWRLTSRASGWGGSGRMREANQASIKDGS